MSRSYRRNVPGTKCIRGFIWGPPRLNREWKEGYHRRLRRKQRHYNKIITKDFDLEEKFYLSGKYNKQLKMNNWDNNKTYWLCDADCFDWPWQKNRK